MMIALTPWRITFLYGIYIVELEEIQLSKNALSVREKKRFAIIGNFFKFLFLDYFTLLLIILTFATIVGIPNLLRIISKHWKNNQGADYLKIFDGYKIKDDQFIVDVWRNLKQSLYVFFVFGFGLIIITLLLNQIPDTYFRIKRLYHKKKVRGDFATHPLYRLYNKWKYRSVKREINKDGP